MKRLFTILLCLCLVLCGCDAGSNTPTQPDTPGQSGGEQTNDPISGGNTMEPTRPAEVELVDYDAPALKLKITINPEMELTLSRTNEILDAKALNTDAEALLAGMDLVGQPYDNGIVTILEKAKEQKYLKDVSKVTISVEELSEGAWTIATEEQLTKPVEDYQQNSGIIFSCRITPAGESLDIDELKVIDTSRTTGVSVTVYGDVAGNAKMMIYETDDGTRQEGYLISDTEEIWINYYSDGSYRYGHIDGLVDQGYWVYPDGRRSTYVEYRELVDGLTQPVWYQETYSDGSAEEYFYENSEWVRTVFTNTDGSTWEAFYENGTIVSEVWKDADGTILEESNGDWVSTGTLSDGSTFELTYYSNGNKKTEYYTWSNGDYIKYTFFENGNQETYTEFREGSYVEYRYDENGRMISSCQRLPDGEENDSVYENGKIKTSYTTWPNGDYMKESYNENGNPETYIEFRDGRYVECYFDESGRPTSHFQQDPDGTTYKTTYYSNGNMKTHDTTWLNGDYMNETYYENGKTASIVADTNGDYWENYYDELGNLTKIIRQDEDGNKYEEPVS